MKERKLMKSESELTDEQINKLRNQLINKLTN